MLWVLSRVWLSRGVLSPDHPSSCLSLVPAQALVVDEKKFQYILRILNTNVNGKDKVMYALTKIKGIGRRFANLICKKAGIDMNKRYVSVALYSRGGSFFSLLLLSVLVLAVSAPCQKLPPERPYAGATRGWKPAAAAACPRVVGDPMASLLRCRSGLERTACQCHFGRGVPTNHA